MICILPPSPERVATAPTRLAVQSSRKWTARGPLRVRFMDGADDLHYYVAQLVTGPRGWNATCAMQFEFGDDPGAEIRVTFQPGSSWSQLGTDALWVRPDQPTMNLAVRLEDSGPHIDRPIGHEFGHALGFIHSHQSPFIGPMDEAVVREWYRSRGYSDSWITSQVLTRYPAEDTEDIGGKRVQSIMAYYQDASFYPDGVAPLPADYPTYWDAYAAETWYGPPPARYTSVILPFVARS